MYVLRMVLAFKSYSIITKHGSAQLIRKLYMNNIIITLNPEDIIVTMSSRALTKLQEYIEVLKHSQRNAETNEMVIDSIIEHLEKTSDPMDNQDKIIALLKDMNKDLKLAADSTYNLSKTTNGNMNTDNDRMEQTDLEIIENGYLLREYKTFEQLKNVSDKTKRLHKHSYIYHCLAAPSVYDIRFPRCSPSKKQNKEKK